MKHSLKSCLLAATTALALVSTAPAYADGLAIGFVNDEKVMHDSKAVADVNEQMKAKQKEFQGSLIAEDKQLRAEDKSLSEEAKNISKDALTEKAKKLHDKAVNAERDVQAKRVQLNKAYLGAIEKIQAAAVDVVKEVAQEKKLNLVLNASHISYADPSLDITDEVLKRLDSKLPSVKVNFQ